MSLRLQTAIASLVLLPSLAFAGINWNDKAVYAFFLAPGNNEFLAALFGEMKP